jgi:uncharacterized protein
MRRLLSCLAAAAVLSHAGSAAAAGQFTGTYRIGANATGTPIELTLAGARVTVSLGAGHAVHQVVALSRRGAHVRFALPGAPAPLAFDGSLSHGTVRQGGAKGTYSLRPGVPAKGGIEPAMLGPYRTASGRGLGVVGFWGPTQIVDLDTGAIRLLSRRTRLVWAAGSTFGGGADGSVTFAADGNGFRWTHADGSVEQATRVPVRQLEVRFPSSGTSQAGTLTLPAGGDRHPAVVTVHGSGYAVRSFWETWDWMLARHGVAVLATDKRGCGQSDGRFAGSYASDRLMHQLAGDVDAAAVTLSRRPDVDPRRIGLLGISQAGWIEPLAAVGSSAVRFIMLLSGPTVSVDQQDLFYQLTGGGDGPATESDAQIHAALAHSQPTGYDPVPAISAMTVPGLWLYAATDRQVPEQESVAILDRLSAEKPHAFTHVVFPTGTHTMFDSPHGQNAEIDAGSGYIPGLIPAVLGWLDRTLPGLQ